MCAYSCARPSVCSVSCANALCETIRLPMFLPCKLLYYFVIEYYKLLF